MRGLPGGATDECRGELITRERRGELSDVDQLALRTHLAACASCHLARALFADLDQDGGLDLHDGARIERMTIAARRWGSRTGGRRGRGAPRAVATSSRVRALVAGILLLVAGTASATLWWFSHPAARAMQGASSTVVEPSDSRRGPPARTGDLGPAPPEGAESVTPMVSSPGAGTILSPGAPQAGKTGKIRTLGTLGTRVRGRAAALEDAMKGLTEAPHTPAAMLRKAGDARRAGAAERAVELYQALQREFPRSPEAVLSAVSLGGLLLEHGLPRAALAQFDGYLVTAKGGVLTPEALYGRGRALAALGDAREERRTWDQLLRDLPNSVYGPFARQRLAELP